MGISYEPLLVSTQVVAGENFKYLCNATLENKVSITSITDVA